MKPVTNLTTSLFMTAAIVLGLGFLASKVPVSIAAESGDGNPVVDIKSATEAVANGLLVEITDVRNNTGKVIVLVFDDAKAFAAYDYEHAVGYSEIVAARGTFNARFPELVTGPYAVTLFHDENEDYNLNMDGPYPLEGYGNSGPKGSYDEPTFDEASVDASRVVVRMTYP